MDLDELVRRWGHAAARADEEKVRVLDLDGQYRAASSSLPLVSYALEKTPEGWACECEANRLHGIPCKHLAALAELLDLDVLNDMVVKADLSDAIP